MPNWCSNQATIHGTKEQILALAGAYERGGVIENYLPTPRDPDDQSRLIGEDDTFQNKNSWYHWRLDNWGTKWDFGKTPYTPDEECDWQVDEEGYGYVHLRFDTAWNPPLGLYEALNKLDMTVEAYFFEPCGAFCGQWSNPVEGIVNEKIKFSIDNHDKIPYTIQQVFNTEEFYADTGDLI